MTILASGSGSNLAAIINAVDKGFIPNTQISLVISNKKDAYALVRAKNAGISTLYAKKSDFADNEEFDKYIVKKLRDAQVDIVILAGYLRILTLPLLESYKNRILNIHPSLLPDFGGKGMYGMKVHEAVIKSGVSTSGCSVHLVNEEIDGGRVLSQISVPIMPEDTPESLAAKVLKEEHTLYPKVIREFISDLKL